MLRRQFVEMVSICSCTDPPSPSLSSYCHQSNLILINITLLESVVGLALIKFPANFDVVYGSELSHPESIAAALE